MLASFNLPPTWSIPSSSTYRLSYLNFMAWLIFWLFIDCSVSVENSVTFIIFRISFSSLNISLGFRYPLQLSQVSLTLLLIFLTQVITFISLNIVRWRTGLPSCLLQQLEHLFSLFLFFSISLDHFLLGFHFPRHLTTIKVLPNSLIQD